MSLGGIWAWNMELAKELPMNSNSGMELAKELPMNSNSGMELAKELPMNSNLGMKLWKLHGIIVFWRWATI